MPIAQQNGSRFFYGNFDEKTCRQIAQKSETTLLSQKQNKAGLQPIDWKHHPQLRLNNIQDNKVYAYEFSLNHEDYNPDEPNSSVWMNFQGRVDTPADRLLMKMLTSVLSEPFFNQLRTNEQLGYAVECYDSRMRGVLTFTFVILSSVACPMRLAHRIEDFIAQQKDLVLNLSEADFQMHKQNIINSLTKKPDSMFKEGKVLYEEVLFNSRMFDRSNLPSLASVKYGI